MPDEAIIDVLSADQIGSYSLHISFSDGTEQIVDLGPFLQASTNPLISEYLDAERFADFYVEYGNLVWEDDGLCFPVADLYENDIV